MWVSEWQVFKKASWSLQIQVSAGNSFSYSPSNTAPTVVQAFWPFPHSFRCEIRREIRRIRFVWFTDFTSPSWATHSGLNILTSHRVFVFIVFSSYHVPWKLFLPVKCHNWQAGRRTRRRRQKETGRASPGSPMAPQTWFRGCCSGAAGRDGLPSANHSSDSAFYGALRLHLINTPSSGNSVLLPVICMVCAFIK